MARIVLLGLSAHTARRIEEVGLLLGAIGGVALLGAAFPASRSIRGGPSVRVGLVALAAVLLVACFVLQIVGVHYG
jgi:amino acid transporter